MKKTLIIGIVLLIILVLFRRHREKQTTLPDSAQVVFNLPDTAPMVDTEDTEETPTLETISTPEIVEPENILFLGSTITPEQQKELKILKDLNNL